MPAPPLNQPLFTAKDLSSLTGLAESSWAVYADENRIANACGERGLILHWFEKGDSQAFGLVLDDNTRLVVFRGTEIEHMRDFVVDSRLGLKRAPYHTWRAHAGFLGAYQLIQQEVLDFAQAMQAGRVFLAGHSLGGALALFAGVDLAGAGLRSHVVTFGQPRVGDAEFGRVVSSQMLNRTLTYTRVVHNNDIVPHVPPPIEYRHCGELLYLDRNQNPSQPSFKDWYMGIWDRVRARKLNDPRSWHVDGIQDHRMGHYVEGMRKVEDVNG